MAAGILIATLVPLVSGSTAFLLANRILQLEPNGPFVQAIQGTALGEIFLGPMGLVVAGRSARLKGILARLALFTVSLPVLAWLWFVAVASLGGLAGEPF